MFYNGNRKIGERMEHRLSDAYETVSGEPALELKVLVININEGHNQKLMESCRILKEYAQYVSKSKNIQENAEFKRNGRKSSGRVHSGGDFAGLSPEAPRGGSRNEYI